MSDAIPPEPDELAGVKDQLLVFTRELNQMLLAERLRRRELEEALDRLEKSYVATIKSLALAVEAKDDYTAGHLERTHRYAVALARRVDPVMAENRAVGYGFLLHDVGKVGVPESILGKDGPLTEGEWELMRQHPEIGERIVSPAEFLKPAVAVIRHHHERWDGKGYPDGLAGEDIPLPARVFTLADTFDAMTTDRPYRKAMPDEAALEEIQRCGGTQFDPDLVGRFAELDLGTTAPGG